MTASQVCSRSTVRRASAPSRPRTAWSGHASVTLTGAVPHHEVPAHLALCDAVAVPYATEDVYFSPLKL
ncbi:MAG: hypothetical protein ACKOC6_04725, partial [bacterium]